MALGEADETWPLIVNSAVAASSEVYAPVDEAGKERKPSLKAYPVIPWQSINIDQFNLVPKAATPLLSRLMEKTK